MDNDLKIKSILITFASEVLGGAIDINDLPSEDQKKMRELIDYHTEDIMMLFV